MTAAEQNYRLLQEIEANRRFLLMAYQQNPKLLESAEARIKQLFDNTALLGGNNTRKGGRIKQRGISLIELIMFIVIISIALTAILSVMNITTRHSADPLIHKQALAIAESLLEEVELMPFTYCDPEDPNAASATAAADCTGGPGGPNDESLLPLGPETAASVGGAEGRYVGGPQFDNVSDYNAFPFVPGAVVDINGTPAPAGYTASIAVAPPAVPLGVVPVAETLLITVTVTGPDGVPVQLDGYRTRYSPNSLP